MSKSLPIFQIPSLQNHLSSSDAAMGSSKTLDVGPTGTQIRVCLDRWIDKH